MPISPGQLQILYHDEHYVAVDKPAGLLVHRSRLDGHRTRFALQTVRDQIGRKVYPVHRLDRPTSGVLLFALSPESAQKLAQAFAEKRVSKTYLAVVRGYTDEDGIIDSPLTRDANAPQKNQVARPSRTDYRRLATIELPFPVGRYPTCRYSLLAVSPLTGRMHQIRRHMHHISHHLIGDTVYGDGRHNRLFRERLGCRRLLLAAVRLAFIHPYTRVETVIETKPQDQFRAVILRFGWDTSGLIQKTEPCP